jgi:hypothetical protein
MRALNVGPRQFFEYPGATNEERNEKLVRAFPPETTEAAPREMAAVLQTLMIEIVQFKGGYKTTRICRGALPSKIHTANPEGRARRPATL